MSGFFSSIVTTLLTVYMSLGGTAAASVPPEETAAEFLDGLSAGNATVLEQYVDNTYVNFLVNSEGDDEELDKMRGAIFRNFSYEITDSAAKGDVAVVQVQLKTDDFSAVLEDYTKDSYKYVSGNLYSDTVTDKDKLAAKCLDIYVSDLEKAAGDEPDLDTELYLPLISDGYGQWNLKLDDDIMKSLLGGLQLPSEEEDK